MSRERLENSTSGIFIFVGENRSKTAQDKGYSWQECQRTGHPVQCAIPLFRAIKKAGFDPNEQIFFNLWNDDGSPADYVRNILKEMAEDGETIIGMGRKVQAELEKFSIPHKKMVHPAALGKIRKADLYDEHVISVLCS